MGNTMGVAIRIAALALVALFTSQPAFSNSAGYDFTVLDPSGRPVADAVVMLESVDTDRAREALTDRAGVARFVRIDPGEYRVKVVAEGFLATSSRISLPADDDGLTIEIRKDRYAQRLLVSSSLPDLAMEERISGGRLRESSRADLAAALADQPGLDATRRGTINLDPQIRGLQETQVGVFVDGTRTFSAGPARMDSGLSHVSLNAISEVRAIKGPYALTWGSGTLSAIQVETYRPEFTTAEMNTEGRIGLTLASNADRTDGFVTYGGASDRIRFNVFGGYRNGGDYEDGEGRAVPAAYTSGDFRWLVGYQNKKGLRIDYSGGYQDQSGLDYPGRLLDATFFKTQSNAVEIEWAPEDRRLRITGQVYMNFKDHEMNNDNKPTAQPDPERVPPFPLKVLLPAESDTWGGQFAYSTDRGSLRWTFGGDFYYLDQNAVRTISRRDTGMMVNRLNVWPGVRIDDHGVYGQLTHSTAGFSLGSTLRVDFVQASADADLVSQFFLDNTSGELDQDETNISAAVSSTVRLTSKWEITTGLGRAVRTANALERYADRFPSTKFQVSAEFLGAPSIRPEQSLELNVETTGTFGKFDLTGGLFYRVIDDYITVEPDPSVPTALPLSFPVVYRHLNGDRAVFSGGDVRLAHHATERLSWRASLGYVRAEDTLYDEPVFGIPPLEGQLAVRYAGGSQRPWWVEAAGLFVDRQDRVAEIRLEIPTPGYSVYALRGGVRLTEALNLDAALENLTDVEYSRHLNALDPFDRSRIPEIGRYLRVGVTYGF